MTSTTRDFHADLPPAASEPTIHDRATGRTRTASAITLGRPAVPTIVGRTVKALGTFCSVLIAYPPALDAAQDILSAELAAIDLACSRFRPDSELSALNRAGGARVTVSPLFATALEVALGAAEITSGDVDPTCGDCLVRLGYDRDFGELAADTSPVTRPPAPAAGWQCVEFNPETRTVRLPAGVLLDFGATAKALAADRAAEAISRQLGCGVLVNLGGDIATAGQAPGGGWKVAVDDGAPGPDAWLPGRGPASSSGAALPPGRAGAISPRTGLAAAGLPAAAKPVVAVESGGLATSGPAVRSWRRGGESMHHIIDPRLGRPAEVYWAAVCVAAATCVDANTASTASIIRGRAAAGWLERLRLPARLARPDGSVVTTAGWPR